MEIKAFIKLLNKWWDGGFELIHFTPTFFVIKYNNGVLPVSSVFFLRYYLREVTMPITNYIICYPFRNSKRLYFYESPDAN